LDAFLLHFYAHAEDKEKSKQSCFTAVAGFVLLFFSGRKHNIATQEELPISKEETVKVNSMI